MSARYAATFLRLTAFLCLLSGTALAAEPSLPAPAQAPVPRVVRLDYSHGPGAEHCPESQTFRDAIGARIARDIFTADAPARLLVMLARRGAGYEGTAELRDAAGAVTWTQVLPGPTRPPAATCASLIDGLAFAVSIELDPVLSPPPPPPLPPVLPPLFVAKPTPIDTPKPPERSPGPFRIGVSPWVDVGTAPRPAIGFSFNLGFRAAWFSLDLEGRWDPPAASTIDGAEVTTTRLVGALVPCGHVGYFSGCLLAEVGPLWGTVTGIERIREGTQSAIYAAIGGRLSIEFPIAPHLALRPAVDLLVALQQPTLRVATVPLFAVSPVGAGFGLGLLASF